jgi:tRNA-dihydrouridine synthase A
VNEYGIKRAQPADIEGKSSNISRFRFSVAPMMDWTDRHCRYFHRLLTRRALLYTEMITSGAVLRGDRARLLRFDESEHPVAVQLGGCEPRALAEAARICADLGFDEVNLNVGCPSDRVQNGRFGACLMAEPQLVADCIAAMKAAVAVPVTVKCRIGIDDQDPDTALAAFANAVIAAGVDRLIVHARKAWLKGLSPRQNRDVPPLDYGCVLRLKAPHPCRPVVLNGGIASLAEAAGHLERFDGVMIGRAAYQEPWRLLDVDPVLFGTPAPAASPVEAAKALIPYVEREVAAGARVNSLLRHVVGLFHAVSGARAFRRRIAMAAVQPGAGAEVLRDALALVTRDAASLYGAPADSAGAGALSAGSEPNERDGHIGRGGGLGESAAA